MEMSVMMSRVWVIAASLTVVPILGGCLGPLHQAAKDGDVRTIQALLDQGLDANATMVSGGGSFTPLYFAVRDGRIEAAKLLLDRGADVNRASGADRFTPLHMATYAEHEQIVKLLLERGADTEVLSSGGVTPLRFAEKRGNVSIAKLIRDAQRERDSSARKSGSGQQVAEVPTIQSDVDRVTALRVSPKKHAYAVVIGIEQYREKLPKADFADRDAKLVGEYLTKVLGYPEENVIVQVNERATGKDLEKYFENWLPNNVEKDGSVFVYYSGHGSPNPKTGDAYLVPYDGDPGFLETTGYPLKRLYASLEKLLAKDVTVVLDSCFSGAGGRSVIAQGLRPMGLSAEHAMKAAGKTVVLSASSGEQVSSTYLNQGHGLMTYFFLKGLQGDGDLNKDGIIDMVELYEYVKPNVQKVARKQYNTEQVPQLLASPDVLKKGGGRLIEARQP
jgi:hypothetical protein